MSGCGTRSRITRSGDKPKHENHQFSEHRVFHDNISIAQQKLRISKPQHKRKVSRSLTNSRGNLVSTWETREGERWKIQCTIFRKTKVSDLQESLVETYIFSVSKSGFRRKVERNNWLDNMNFLCGVKVSFQLLRLSILFYRKDIIFFLDKIRLYYTSFRTYKKWIFTDIFSDKKRELFIFLRRWWNFV